MARDEKESFPEFDLSQHRTEEPVDRKPVTLWIPIPFKEKFEDLQGRSGKAYGRFLQKMLVESIERTSKKYGI